MKRSKLVTFIIGIVLILASIVSTAIVGAPTFKEETIKFNSVYNEEEVTLKGSYYKVENASYAVLMCPGYSCDRQKLRPFANVFIKNGMSVMTFDYSGQASSYGKIGFDNAKKDDITKQIADAAVELHTISKIAYSNIILIGHSMGGRALLRLMYDINGTDTNTLLTSNQITNLGKIKNIILMSPEVNYSYSAQASLFAGTSDYDEEPWKSFNVSYTKGFNVFLYGSTADDVVSDEDILALYARLGGNKAPSSGKTDFIKETNSVGSLIAVRVVPGVLHSYQWYSPQFVTNINYTINRILIKNGNSKKYPSWLISLVYVSYVTSLVGILLTLLSLNSISKWEPADLNMNIVDTKKFLLRKLLMWLPGIVVAFIVCCICVVMPFGSPIMNIPYMCFIAGYGIVMAVIYAKGKMKGVEGKLPKPTTKFNNKVSNILIALATTALLIGLVIYVTKASMYRLIPMNIRIFWLIFNTILMSIGYYVSSVETDMLDSINANTKTKVLYNLIQYVALFLFVLFYLIIKSYSGVIQQAVNLVIMYILVIPLGSFVKKQTGNRAYGAVVSSFVFQMFMITSAAIISFF